MLDIVRYSTEYRSVWEGVVTDSLNGTFLHTRAFFDHNAANELDDYSFLFYKKNKYVAVIPCTLYEKEGRRILNSHLRSTYGGFIITDKIGAEEAVEMVEKLIKEARELDVNEIIIRNPFRIFNQKICDESDYAMWYHGFKIKYRELETVVQLNDYDYAQTSYESSTKRSIKKSKEHVTVKLSENFEEYWKLLEKNLLTSHGAKPTHSFDSFESLLEKVGTEKIKLFAGYKDDQMICGIVVFVANTIALHAQYIASDYEFQEFRSLNAVIDNIIKWGIENKFSFLNLGTSNTDGGRNINSGLFRFKEGFGGRNILRETMHLVF